jgi:hypothetical protein
LVDPNILGGAAFFEGMAQEVAGLMADNGAEQDQLKIALNHSKQTSQLTSSAMDTLSEVNVAEAVMQ